MFNRDFLKLMSSMDNPSKVSAPYVFIEPDGSVLVSSYGWRCSLPAGTVKTTTEITLTAPLKHLMEHWKGTADLNLDWFTPIPGLVTHNKPAEVLTTLSTASMRDIKSVLWALPEKSDPPRNARLSGVLLDLDDDTWQFVATDTAYMAVRKVGQIENLCRRVQFLIPTALAKLIAKPPTVLKDIEIITVDDGTYLTINISGMNFRLESLETSMQQYPDWERVIPSTREPLTGAATLLVPQLLERCKAFAAAKEPVPVTLSKGDLYIADVRVQQDMNLPDQSWTFDGERLAKVLKAWPLTGNIMLSPCGKSASIVGFVGSDTVMIAGYVAKK